MPVTIQIRFYEELNDFLPLVRRKKTFSHSFEGNMTIKDIIESLGVPHTEIDLILVNGQSVDFKYRPKEGDQVSVYPVFESFDIANVTRLRPKPLRETRFILDVHLGKLARYLRMTGFDTLYENDYEDNQIIQIAKKEHRIILTRDLGILKNGNVTHGYFIRSQNPKAQLNEVIESFDLKGQIQPFNRCMNCNSKIVCVEKKDIANQLLPKTLRYFDEFFQCTGCGKIYWEGSHYKKMLNRIESLNNH
ncbi:MAG: Mut7-C ubiquitin/RNAse domain-containing protein [Bacteroidales bacterium]|nr:Mut7-C ubiquitin/RNAse domain-containing protein [Bacteroidales bacterium]